MEELFIPGFRELKIRHIVLDFNGTIAFDGQLIEGVSVAIHELALHYNIHVLTADTYGNVSSALEDLPVMIQKLCPKEPHLPGCEAEEKLKHIQRLGVDEVMAIGNGANDASMLKAAVLGIAVIGPEGCATSALLSSDIVAGSILEAFGLVLHPLRLKASLRQ